MGGEQMSKMRFQVIFRLRKLLATTADSQAASSVSARKKMKY